MIVASNLPEIAQSMGASNAAVIEVSAIKFNPVFRAACEANTCGHYGRCWMCPPDVGDINELIAQAEQYKYALVFQTVAILEDSFDIEGMEEAAVKHNRLSEKLDREIGAGFNGYLRLGAGSCGVCESCSKRENKPCRYPERAVPSLEAYGISVADLARVSGIKYINGQNTVTYFGAFLFN